MFHLTDDLRIDNLRPLIPPAILMEELPLMDDLSSLIASCRQQTMDIIQGKDHRLIAIVGPCSIHNSEAAIEYAGLLKEYVDKLADDLFIMMRVYFEKPRTTVGWKGLINDPHLDGSFDINNGLRKARKLLIDIGHIGVGAGHEFLDTISPQFIADLISWGAIGARTTESQIHRELASGLSVPVGFKNGTDGNIQIAIDAIRAAVNPHHFLSVTKQGLSAIVSTKGNDSCHVILRGSTQGSNYDEASIQYTSKLLLENHIHNKIMIDCSHGNSGKDYTKQPEVAESIAIGLESGNHQVCGVMIESHLIDGCQKMIPGEPLKYGQSITDACLGWKKTIPVLERLAQASRKRKKLIS